MRLRAGGIVARLIFDLVYRRLAAVDRHPGFVFRLALLDFNLLPLKPAADVETLRFAFRLALVDRAVEITLIAAPRVCGDVFVLEFGLSAISCASVLLPLPCVDRKLIFSLALHVARFLVPAFGSHQIRHADFLALGDSQAAVLKPSVRKVDVRGGIHGSTPLAWITSPGYPLYCLWTPTGRKTTRSSVPSALTLRTIAGETPGSLGGLRNAK